ncbi:MAG: uroporphyrinogen decarboxylase [Rhodospirillaceae bacterium]|nr:MAG: uroporphyrinogen decarboxylase [Rhodospirillaceae bacterium]
MTTTDKLILRSLKGETLTRPPFWLMRQAGRYLPEYRAARAKAGSFLDLCYHPDLAVEVTLQPIRRFGMDAAILFSDILVVADGLGHKVRFEEGRGPLLDALNPDDDLRGLQVDRVVPHLAPVYQTVADIKAKLPAETALIGFAGAPWTVASYMIEGCGSRDYAKAKSWIYRHPDLFKRLIDLLIEATTRHLAAQIEAGAELVQLFDSWAGALDHAAMINWSLQPCREIVTRLRAQYPAVPVIVFPRGVGAGYLDFAQAGFMQGLGLDTGVPPDWARNAMPGQFALQGNLDPQILVAGGEAMRRSVTSLLAGLNSRPYIFNLGHGIVPETPPEHVAALAELIRNWKS